MSETTPILIFVLLKFSEVPTPPFFKILRTLRSTTNLLQKRRRNEVSHDMQGGKAEKTAADTSTPTSYAGAVKASNQKLNITRKESEGDMLVWTAWIFVRFKVLSQK